MDDETSVFIEKLMEANQAFMTISIDRYLKRAPDRLVYNNFKLRLYELAELFTEIEKTTFDKPPYNLTMFNFNN